MNLSSVHTHEIYLPSVDSIKDNIIINGRAAFRTDRVQEVINPHPKFISVIMRC